MPTLRLADLRSARHWLAILGRLSREFQRHEDRAGVLACFDQHLLQIRHAFSLVRKASTIDEDFAALCRSYALEGEDVLGFRLSASERVEWLKAALAVSGVEADPHSKARLLLRLGQSHLVLGQIDEAVLCQEECLRISRFSGDRRLEGSALSALGHSLITRAPGRAFDCFRSRLELAQARADRQEETWALGDLSAVEISVGRIREAIAHDEQRLRIARVEGDWSQEGYTLSHLCLGYLRLGRYRRARQLAEQALLVAKAHHERSLEGFALGNLGAVAILERRFDRALDVFLLRLKNAKQIGDHKDEGFALGDLGGLYIIQRNFVAAMECYQTRLGNAVSDGDFEEQGYALGNLGSLYLDMGNIDRARDYFTQRLENANHSGIREERLFALSNLGMLELTAGRFDRATELYREKLALARETADRDMEAQALTNLGMTQILGGAKPAGKACLSEARKIYRELSRKVPLRYRFSRFLLLCPTVLLRTVVAFVKRLRPVLLSQGIRYRVEHRRS